MRMRLTISGRLFLLLSVPATLLVILSLWLMSERWQSAQTLDNVGALADRAPIISGLVHEMQKERGYSAGFIGSKGKQFADRLDGQRISTDKALKAYETELASLDLSPYSEHFRTLLSDVGGAIGKLRNKRAEVDRFALSVGQMAGYYTGTINQLIGLVEDIGKQSTIDQLAQTTLAYEAIILAKERAGLERAMGANGFGKGKFEPNILRRFVDLVGQQRAFLKFFATEANAEQLAFYEATLTGPVIDEVERLRDIATRSPFTSDLQGVTGPEWFDAITKKINLYKTVEDRLAEDLVRIAAEKGTEAITGFWTITIVLSIAVFATVLLGWYVSRDIVKAIRGTVDTIAKLARGEDTQVQGVERSDEIGVLSRSLETVYQKGLEAARLRSALEGCSTMIMVANRHYDVIFANGVMKQLFQTNEQDFRSDLPAFDQQSLIGTDLGKFSPELDALRETVQTAKATQHVDIALGSRRFKVSVSPVVSETGRFLGTVVEWIDLTSELVIQEDIGRVIGAARNGDFSQRIELKGADGIYGNLADGMNQLTGVIDNAADELGMMLEAMAKGDLSRRMSAEFQGKFGELRDNANSMADQLTDIVGQVQNATDEIRNASSEISAGTEDLSNRTEQAASNLEETAAASDQMSATVKQNAENAKNANQLALSANQVASRGADVVEKAVSAMSEIDGSAQRITQIISVIDEIAFQTNLLALNASVEAARAGESGKGFAVVAQEVRQLAQRSAQAADDIKALIKSSNEQVEGGVKLVNQAGETLAEILGSIGQVTSIVQDISGASQEQAAGVLEITSSINNMDEMTQQNSALVEESAASARALDDQAQRLNELMGFFKTDHTVAAARRPARSAAPKAKAPVVQRPVTEPAPALTDDGWADF